jgi:hypothetical protein
MIRIETSSRRGETFVPNDKTLTFEFEVGTEGEFVEMTAKPPTPGQFAKYVKATRSNNMFDVTIGCLELLKALLDTKSYNIIEDELDAGLDVSHLLAAVNELVKEWSARPTGSSNGSSPLPKKTGGRSTVPRRLPE